MKFEQGAVAFLYNERVTTLHEAGRFGVDIGPPTGKLFQSSFSAVSSIWIRQIGYLQKQRLKINVYYIMNAKDIKYCNYHK